MWNIAGAPPWRQQFRCPSWEYENFENWSQTLTKRSEQVAISIGRAKPEQLEKLVKDTRPVHGPYFFELTPNGFDYYAGNYRGQDFDCLRQYEVHTAHDERVGHTAATVPIEMSNACPELIDQAFAQLNLVWEANERLYPREWKVYRAIELAAAIFVYFLEIHPYANGNGHMGRLIVTAFLARYGIRIKTWPVHPRPPHPQYAEFIKDYRSGKRDGLEKFLLSCL